MLDQPLTGVLVTTLAAAEAGVLADNGATLAFRHDLLRRAVLDATPASIVRSLHRRAADVLTERGGDPRGSPPACSPVAIPATPPTTNAWSPWAAPRRPQPRGGRRSAGVGARGVRARRPPSTELALELGWALVAAGRAGDVPALIDDPIRSPARSAVDRAPAPAGDRPEPVRPHRRGCRTLRRHGCGAADPRVRRRRSRRRRRRR